jgi:hypothetical protein
LYLPQAEKKGCLLQTTFAKASVVDGSTGDKQTSKGLFIFPLPFLAEEMSLIRALFSQLIAGLRDEIF